MGMNVSSGSSGEPEPMMEINTTPLIDVMLVLIIMLIITIPPQTHAVKLNMPVDTKQPKPPKEPEIVKIDVDFDGTIFWNGATVADRVDLESRLRSAASQAEQPEVHLRPNKLAKYKSVAMVMTSAQRLGLTKLGIVGNEQFVK
jgi:biopolymer transport protein ExbD